MRVLVTGSTGFIGRHVVAELRHKGHQVRALVRDTSKDWKVERLKELECELAVGDVTDIASLRLATRDCDAVVHTAALVRLGKVDDELMHRVNVVGTENVLRASRQSGVGKVLHVSSIAALGVNEDTEADEDTRHRGSYGSPYERTKHLASLVADEYADNGLHVVQALPAVVFGRSDPNFGVFFKGFVRRRYPVLPAPDTVLSLVHVEDLARGIVLALEKGERGDRFIFTQKNIRLDELFQIMEQATGLKAPRVHVPARPARAMVKAAAAVSQITPWRGWLSKRSADILGRHRTYSNGRARTVLGWDPGDFEARLADTARYYALKYGPRSVRQTLEEEAADESMEAPAR